MSYGNELNLPDSSKKEDGSKAKKSKREDWRMDPKKGTSFGSYSLILVLRRQPVSFSKYLKRPESLNIRCGCFKRP